MKNLLNYIFWGILFAFLAWFKIKELKSSSERKEQVKNMSPDFFSQKRAKILPKDYIKWLEKFYTLISVDAMERRDKSIKIEPELINALILTEKEIENVNARMGAQINLGEKASDEFKKLK